MTVAVLSRPWGIRGELTAIPFSDHPERFENLGRVYLFGAGETFEVESVRSVSGSLLFKFRGIDSINDAEPWRGAEVRIPRGERLQLEPDEFSLATWSDVRSLSARQASRWARLPDSTTAVRAGCCTLVRIC